MRISRTPAAALAAIVAVATILATGPGAAYANDSASATTRTAAALAPAGNLVVSAAPTTSDADSAAQNANVDVPLDPAKGVALKTSDNKTMTIGLPNAGKLKTGIKLNNGAVLYRGTNGVDVVVVPSTFSAQFLTIINGKNAPEDYAYPATVPQGGMTAVTSDGRAIIFDANHTAIALIAKAWAVDAAKRQIPTQFVATGSNITQHIGHKSANAIYPVVADPHIDFHAINYRVVWNKQEVKATSGQFANTVLAALVGYGCSALKHWTLIGSCIALVTGAAYWINLNFEDARANNQCAYVAISYGGDLDGWGRHDC